VIQTQSATAPARTGAQLGAFHPDLVSRAGSSQVSELGAEGRIWRETQHRHGAVERQKVAKNRHPSSALAVVLGCERDRWPRPTGPAAQHFAGLEPNGPIGAHWGGVAWSGVGGP